MLLHQALGPVMALGQAPLKRIEAQRKAWTKPASDSLAGGAGGYPLRTRTDRAHRRSYRPGDCLWGHFPVA